MNALVVATPRTARLAFLVLCCAAVVALFPGRAHAFERFREFDAAYTINPDGTVDVVETIAWDFGDEAHHGIFRDLVDSQECTGVREGAQSPLYPCKDGFERHYDYDVYLVTAAPGLPGDGEVGTPVPYDSSGEGDGIRIKIGDPDKTVTGPWVYTIGYTIHGTLDAFDDHDELFWRATGGGWTLTIEKATVAVYLPVGLTGVRAACGAGPDGDGPCDADDSDPTLLVFSADQIRPQNEMKFVVGWDRGPIAVAPPKLEDILSADDFFTLDATEWAGAASVGGLGIVGLAAIWWREGRDRRYRTMWYLTQNTGEQTQPLFGRTDVVVEFTPPDELRPAQMGLILDERADTLDVTATVVDLAVRGYIHITAQPKKGIFGHGDWELKRLKEADDQLMPYEKEVLRGLFDKGEVVELSALENEFHTHLAKAQKQLYDDAMKRKWFGRRPTTARDVWLGVGIGVVVLGVLASAALGYFYARAVIGIPIIICGVVLMLLSRAMASRTAKGSEALRRVLGFRRYVATAETRQHEFNEQQNIFARYLPYAIVFGCVDKWAKAFEGLEGRPETDVSGWYAGYAAFNVATFSSGMRGFASTVSSTIVSAPHSSGSGFSGGGFSGGGGGGGGGSW